MNTYRMIMEFMTWVDSYKNSAEVYFTSALFLILDQSN